MNDDELRREVERLRDEVDALHRRLEAIESEPPPESEPGETDDVDGSDEPTAAEDVATTGDEPDDPPESPDAASTESPGGSAVSERLAADRDWELALGVRWLGLVGALALVVGVVFFVRLAIEIGLLGPAGRVALGALAGVGLLAGGRFAATRQGYVRWGRIAAGTGLAIAYFSVYAAYGFDSYREAIGTPLWAVLAALTALVAVAAIVSVRDGAPLVAGEAFLLGYVTATLSTDAATVVLTPAYVLLLGAGLVAIATIRPWSRLVSASTFATYGVLLLWLVAVEPPAAAIGAAGGLAFVLYLIGGYVLRLVELRTEGVSGRLNRVRLALVTVANAAFATLFLEIALRDGFPETAIDGVGAVAVALALAVTYAATDRGPVRRDGAAAASAVAVLAIGIAMAAGPFATTVGALAVVVAAVAISRIADAPGFRVGAHVVAGGVLLKLLAVDATRLSGFDAADPVATLTGRPVAFAIAIGTFYALSWWLQRTDSLTDVERRFAPPTVAGYAVAATGLGAVVLALELSGLGISVAWVLFGSALLGVGLASDVRGVRMLGITVLGLATAKVFLFDTRDLDTVARTLSFLVLGAVLLTASYVYARSRGDLEIDLELPDRREE
ncbi:DUF2339 domain-containing protein [Natrarchaeobius chitinivorans]|uniref:DUF2339 domain-containing protein n=1 Tax=Natrarchaeobius chitinivorans TaxID=1679083 RepID=A0A3N6NCW6_NATCH|nr:DUF2339 domain-containing protein [Natrarchaeobius chitinivorans]RQG96612.1 DUF2339 domain-containing protein [Natrarchaeobius chitinivorans]